MYACTQSHHHMVLQFLTLLGLARLYCMHPAVVATYICTMYVWVIRKISLQRILIIQLTMIMLSQPGIMETSGHIFVYLYGSDHVNIGQTDPLHNSKYGFKLYQGKCCDMQEAN